MGVAVGEGGKISGGEVWKVRSNERRESRGNH